MRGKRKNTVWILVFCLAICGMTADAAGENAAGMSVQPESLAFCGIRSLQETEPNLTGQDVSVAAVCRSMTYLNGLPQDDYRLNMAHQSLKGAAVLFPDGSQGYYGLSSHATAIGGILVGWDPYGIHLEAGNFFYKGICPNAVVEVYEFWRFVSLTVFGGMDFQADVVTLSLGGLYQDWWTRGIDRLADEKGVLVVAAAGNGISAGDFVLYPAAEANVLAVGVLDAEPQPEGKLGLGSFSLPRKGRSSFGPTAEQRCKPDLVAPGRALVPTAYDTMAYEIAGDYSSLAAPTVSGTAALLIQKANAAAALRDRLGTEGRNCVLKAILMTSAKKLPWWHKGQPGTEDDLRSPLDFLQGAGLLDAMGAYRLLAEGGSPQTGSQKGWDNTILNADRPAAVYPIQVSEPQGQFLTATMVWNRHYDNKYPFHPRAESDSDLRLELWAVDPVSSARILLDVSDSPNDTLEHIYIPLAPEYREYELVAGYGNPDSIREGQQERIGAAWTVGPDSSADNPWWYDLNEDGRIDETDKVVYLVFDRDQRDILEQPRILEALNLSGERSVLLAEHWDQWRPYLGQWHAPFGENAEITP